MGAYGCPPETVALCRPPCLPKVGLCGRIAVVECPSALLELSRMSGLSAVVGRAFDGDRCGVIEGFLLAGLFDKLLLSGLDAGGVQLLSKTLCLPSIS